jgi:hypothetical protein
MQCGLCGYPGTLSSHHLPFLSLLSPHLHTHLLNIPKAEAPDTRVKTWDAGLSLH